MPCILVILLPTLLTACLSTKTVIIDKTRVPLLEPPEFPIADLMTDNKDGTTTVDSEWIVKLEEFHIRYDELRKNYLMIQKLYEKTEDAVEASSETLCTLVQE